MTTKKQIKIIKTQMGVIKEQLKQREIEMLEFQNFVIKLLKDKYIFVINPPQKVRDKQDWIVIPNYEGNA